MSGTIQSTKKYSMYELNKNSNICTVQYMHAAALAQPILMLLYALLLLKEYYRNFPSM